MLENINVILLLWNVWDWPVKIWPLFGQWLEPFDPSEELFLYYMRNSLGSPLNALSVSKDPSLRLVRVKYLLCKLGKCSANHSPDIHYLALWISLYAFMTSKDSSIQQKLKVAPIQVSRVLLSTEFLSLQNLAMQPLAA